MARGAFGALAVAAALTAAACKGDNGDDVQSLAREGDADLVVFVDRRASGVTFDEEREPNDDIDAAQEVEIPGGVRGDLEGEEDEDRFRVEAKEELELSALVSGAEDVDLMVDVLDDEGEQIVRSDHAPKGEGEGVPNLPLDPGVYYVQIAEYVGNRERGGEGARSASSEPYELVIEQHEREPGYELEENDEIDSASEIEIDRDSFGFLGWHGDVDVWAIPLGGILETDALNIGITGTPWVTPKVELLGEEGEVLLSRQGRRGEPIYLHNVAAHRALEEVEGEGDALYLRLQSPRSNPEEPYRLQVERGELEAEGELEPNDERELATPLRDDMGDVEGTRRGQLDVGDVDAYRLGASPGPRVLNASVDPASGLEARIEVVVDGDVIGEAEAQGGASAVVSDLDVPAGRSAYVIVRGESAQPAGGGYELHWSLH